MPDALELLTDQHEHIDALLTRARTSIEGRREVIAELADYVTAHLAVEQELFYPTLVVQLSAVVRAEMLAEHAEIKRVLADLLWLDDDDPRFAPTLAMLDDLVGGHAAWQGEELFESVAEISSTLALATLGATIDAAFASIRRAEFAHAA